MSQDKYFRKELAAEIRRVERLIKKEPSFEKKIYYFSAAYGATGRTYRYSFSKDILLTDFVLQTCYNLFIERANRIKTGDQTVAINNSHFEKLCGELKNLADNIESEENLQGTLENLILIAFSTTGPGNYIMEKGDFNL